MNSLKEVIKFVHEKCSPYASILWGIVFAIVISFIYLCTKQSLTVEPFDTLMDEKISSRNTVLQKEMDIEKHEDDYVSIVSNMRDNINLSITREIAKYSDVIAENPVSKNALKAISDINSLNAFSDALTKTSEFLEG